jgi:hypothetical protein
LAEVLVDITADVTGRTELLIKLAGGTELKARVEIRQPEELEVQVEIRQLKELEVFDALRLSVKVLAEVLPEVLTDVAVDVLAELEVLLIAVHY